MNWDWIITVSIIGGLILVAFAKVSHQTIPELIMGIREALSDRKDEVSDSLVSNYSLYK